MGQLLESTRRRARAQSEKRLRRSSILDAARGVFDETPYPAITMVNVARASGLAKGTLYLYFTSKDQLFLELVLEELDGWLAALRAAVATCAGDPDAVAGLAARSFSDRRRLTRFLPLLHGVLEHGLDEASALGFRRRLAALLEEGAVAVSNALPALTTEDARHFLLRLQAAVVGLAQMAAPAPVVEKVLDENAELAGLRVDLEAELVHVATALLRHVSAVAH